MKRRGAASWRSRWPAPWSRSPRPRGPPSRDARAEHQVSYRYVVLGYVTDAAEPGPSGVRVELRREKTGFSYLGETDADGFYLIVARLGDESAGRPCSSGPRARR